jgi:hypothetical protein
VEREWDTTEEWLKEFDESYLRASIIKLRFRHLNMDDKDDQLAVEEFNANGMVIPFRLMNISIMGCHLSRFLRRQ